MPELSGIGAPNGLCSLVVRTFTVPDVKMGESAGATLARFKVVPLAVPPPGGSVASGFGLMLATGCNSNCTWPETPKARPLTCACRSLTAPKTPAHTADTTAHVRRNVRFTVCPPQFVVKCAGATAQQTRYPLFRRVFRLQGDLVCRMRTVACFYRPSSWARTAQAQRCDLPRFATSDRSRRAYGLRGAEDVILVAHMLLKSHE